MALAILDFEEFQAQQAVFKIDIGTNSFYKLKIGSGKEDMEGMEMVTGVTASTRLKKKQSTGSDYFETSEEIKLPESLFSNNNCYIQLLSCKDESGKSSAISKVVRVPVQFHNVQTNLLDFNSSTTVMVNQTFNKNRQLSQRHVFFAHQSSIDDMLSLLVRNVLPAALNLFGRPSANGITPTTGSNQTDIANSIGGLISLLSRLFPAQAASLSVQQSVTNGSLHTNRFTQSSANYSRPFIFGIDDALIGMVAGPLLQQVLPLLPQLINSANQYQLDTLRANNEYISGINAEVGREEMLRLLMDGLQSSGAAGGSAMNPSQLMLLLQQMGGSGATAPRLASAAVPVATSPAPAAAPPSTAASLSLRMPRITSLSNNVLLTFENLAPTKWNGTDRFLFQKNKPVTFSLRFAVNPAPKSALPKAIFKFTIKDPEQQKIVFEKTFKQKNIATNRVISFTIPAEELSALPAQVKLCVYAEMRWQSASSGKEYKSVGAEEVVFVGDWFVKETGAALPGEKELTDLNTYRSFWNKVWESQSLSKDSEKTLWEVDADLKYSVFLSPAHDANGLIETKIQQTPDDSDSLTLRTYGKIKSGIELSLAELNKLCLLWQGENPLEKAKLDAVCSAEFAKNNATEFIQNVKMKGRAGERGLIWVVPVFKLIEVTLCKVTETSTTGQVASSLQEKVKFPVPVSGRILGLKTKK